MIWISLNGEIPGLQCSRTVVMTSSNSQEFIIILKNVKRQNGTENLCVDLEITKYK